MNKTLKVIFVGILLIVFLFILSACNRFVKDGEKITVVATTNIIADLVRSVAGDRIEVRHLMGAGVDPHLYIASAADIGKLEEADVIFYNGLHLEGKMVEIFESLEERGKNTVAVGEKFVDKSKLIVSGNFAGNYDPHVWFDIHIWLDALKAVNSELRRIDPENAPYYQQNFENYSIELANLDKWAHQEISKIPEKQRLLITSHDAFSYFGKEYGLEVMGIQGISTASEYGLKDIIALADIIRQRGLKAIFVENSISPKSIEALRQAVKSQGDDVKIGGTLYSDTLGDPQQDEGTFSGMFRYNVNTLVDNLK